MRPRKDFASDLQYKKYLLAVEYAEKIIDLQNRGYLILEPDGSVLMGKMAVLEDNDFAAVGLVEGNCTIGIICFSYGDDNIPWIEDTMKDIHSIFRDFKCVRPADIYGIRIKESKYIKKFKKGELL